MIGGAPLGGEALAGSTASTSGSYTIALDVGAFRLLGDGEVLHPQYPVNVDAGGFALAGPDVFLLKPTYTVQLQPGTFALGGSATLQRNVIFPLLPGSYSFLVQASAVYGRVVALAPGALALAGQPVQCFNGYAVQAGVGAFQLGGTIALRATRVLPVAPGKLALTPLAAKLRQGHVLAIGERALFLTGSDATFAAGYTMHLDPGVLVVTRPAALLRATRILPAQPDALGLASPDATLSARHAIILRSGTFSLLGGVSLARGRVAAIPTLALVLGGPAVKTAATRRLTLGTGALALVAPVPVLRAARAAALPVGVVTLSGQPMSARVRRSFALDPGAFVVSPAQALLGRPSRTLPLAPGAFQIGAPAVAATYSGDLGDLLTGPRWAMLSTVTVQGDQAISEAALPASTPLVASAGSKTAGAGSTGGEPQTYPIVDMAEITINHGLDYIPRVTVTDVSGVEYEGDKVHGAGVVTVSLGEPLTGIVTIGG